MPLLTQLHPALSNIRKSWIIVGLLVALLTFTLQELRVFDLADAYWMKGFFMLRRTLHLERGRESNIVLVPVTTDSIDKIGSWPWKRSVWGTLIDKLEQGKAKVVAFDIDFSTPSAEDAQFAAALNKPNVILPLWFEYKEAGKISVLESPLRVEFPSPTLAAKSLQGFVNVQTGALGVRRSLLLAHYNGKSYPSLALQAYLLNNQTSAQAVSFQTRRLTIDHDTVPLDRTGSLWINYKEPRFQTIPVEAILDPKFNSPTFFRDKIVLVGVVSPVGNDIKITPLGAMPGLEIHAEILRGLLERDFIAPLNPVLQFFFLLCLGVGLGASFPRYSWKRFLPWSLGILLGIPFIGFLAFTFLGILVDAFAPCTVVFGMVMLIVMSQSRKTEAILESKIDEIKIISQVSSLHTGNLSVDELLKAAIQMIEEVLQVEAAGILLRDHTGKLTLQACHGVMCTTPERILESNEGICTRVADLGKPLYVGDLAACEDAAKFETMIRRLCFLGVPLRTKGKVIGVIWAATDYPEQLRGEPVNSFITMANQLAIGIDNSLLSDQIGKLYLDAIRSLVRAVEYYHPTNKGHSERVASYALMIGKACNLSPEELETLRSAALLHDIGKMGHFESLYRKPEGLTADDWKQIVQPLKLELKILEPLSNQFPILPILYHFYERFDGKGFPDGLKGNEIPIESRVLAIANAFDDISVNGPQLGRVSIERAVQELKKEAGTLFDPNMVMLFINSISQVPVEEFARHVKSMA